MMMVTTTTNTTRAHETSDSVPGPPQPLSELMPPLPDSHTPAVALTCPGMQNFLMPVPRTLST